MADTVNPQITDAVTATAPSAGGEAELLHVVRGEAGAVALVLCPSEGRASFDADFIDCEVPVPARIPVGTSLRASLSMEIDLVDGAAAAELAAWICANVEPCEATAAADPGARPKTTVMFRVSGGGASVALAWDPEIGRVYYVVRADNLDLQVPSGVEWSPGRAPISARVSVPLANTAVACELARWIQATIPPEPEAEAEPDAEPEPEPE